MSLVPDTESAQTGLFLADQWVLLSNWWDNQSSSQKVPKGGVYYFVIIKHKCWLD